MELPQPTYLPAAAEKLTFNQAGSVAPSVDPPDRIISVVLVHDGIPEAFVIGVPASEASNPGGAAANARGHMTDDADHTRPLSWSSRLRSDQIDVAARASASGDDSLISEIAEIVSAVVRKTPDLAITERQHLSVTASGGEFREEISDAEARVLRYLPTNLTAPEIAAELYVSVHTVKTHMRHIYSKLDAHRRRDAVERARALGLLGHRRA
jgi:DNA-binding CsgD family transcriptional regulator